ncbi:MAG: tetratricopeptide repeat protein [Ignavibacteria bacterium]|jgi:adenylate cyclase|nr:tetratricopeptide repeat protein [Ignavibacteria bacterium]
MTHEELKTKVEELEVLIKSGKDYDQAETQARELLAENALINEPELHCRILLALSESLWRRGMAKDALPYAEQAFALAEQIESKELQAKALGYIGTVHSDLSDYPRALEYLGKALSLAEALGNKAGMAAHLSNIGIVHLEHSDYALALEYFGKALALDEALGNKAGMAGCLGNIGNVYANLSDYARALEYLGRALSLNEELDNKAGMAIQFGNIGVVHAQLSDYVRALEYFGKALALHEELGNKALVANWLGNIGNVHYSLSDYARALEYLGKALALHEELGDKVGVANWLTGIGTVHRNFSDYARALEYYGKALSLHEELGNKSGVAVCLGNIGETYTKHDFDGCDPEKAEEFLLRAIAMNEELGTKGQNVNVFKGLSELYATSERWKESREQFEKYHNLEKEVQSEEAKKKASLMEQRRQAAEREKEIEIERTRATAEKRILNNILPEEITQRLIKGENPIADHYDSVSVLFMDIVEFTTLCTKVSAQQLVHLLNAIFSSADAVMREFGLEKIKTIGDAYMAVAGAPIVQEDHAHRAANAALKLLEVMENLEVSFPPEYGDRSWIESIPEIEVRIGLHCGAAAAGVVGENKFLYDLWGDAVNTASRMESHGEAGKIHVSDDFCIAVETVHAPSLRFIPRGEMEIKGKGMMKTYFLEKLSEPD